jgi:hypothetical protein
MPVPGLSWPARGRPVPNGLPEVREDDHVYGVACSACGYLWRAARDPDALVRYRRLAEVIEQPVTWLWPKYIAAGKLNLLIRQ